MSMERVVPRLWRGMLAAAMLGLFALLATAPAQAYPWGWHHGWGWGWGWGGYWGPWPWYAAPYPYYYPPPSPPVVVVEPQATAPAQSSCKAGNWRLQDGKTVAGTACLQADGTWRLSQ